MSELSKALAIDNNVLTVDTYEVRNIVVFLKEVIMFLAAPFIGLAYIALFPFIGLGMLAWYGVKALRR
jgi:hypothetical protein